MRRVVLDLVSPIVSEKYKERSHYQGMSQAGHCSRQIWMGQRGFGAKPLPASITTFADGNLHEVDVVNLLSERYTVYDRQVDERGVLVLDEKGHTKQWELVSDEEVFSGSCHREKCPCRRFELSGADSCDECTHRYRYHAQFRGHIDGVIEVNGEWYLLEVKSRNDKGFLRVVRDGVKAGHFGAYMQIQTYLYHVFQTNQLPFPIVGALYVAKCKVDPIQSDSSYHCEVVDYDPQLAAQIIAFESLKSRWLQDHEIIPAALEINEAGEIAEVKRQWSPLCGPRYCMVRAECLKYPVGEAVDLVEEEML